MFTSPYANITTHQQQLENLSNGGNTSTGDNKQDNSTPPKYDDGDIPFGDAKAEDVGDEW